VQLIVTELGFYQRNKKVAQMGEGAEFCSAKSNRFMFYLIILSVG